MSTCIFCKIINQEIPGHILYENEDVLAFLDISQTTKGHALVIPKEHVPNIFEMKENQMKQVFSIVPKLANALKESFNASGMNILSNNEAVAGQTVFHFHVHLIPRYEENDTFNISYTNNMDAYSEEKLKALKEEIKQVL